MINGFLEILPQLFTFVLVVDGSTSSERVLRGSTNIVGLVTVLELMLLKNAVDMKLCKLEGTLIHAFLLCVIYFGTVSNMLELFFN